MDPIYNPESLQCTEISPERRKSGRPRKHLVAPIAVGSKQSPGRPRKHPVPDVTVLIQESLEPPFTDSRRKEINGLLEKGVFAIVTREDVPQGTRIFNSRFINEIKHPGINKIFEKSRLVVQVYNNQDKNLILI